MAAAQENIVSVKQALSGNVAAGGTVTVVPAATLPDNACLTLTVFFCAAAMP